MIDVLIKESVPIRFQGRVLKTQHRLTAALLPGNLPNWQIAGVIEIGLSALDRTQEGVASWEQARYQCFGFLPGCRAIGVFDQDFGEAPIAKSQRFKPSRRQSNIRVVRMSEYARLDGDAVSISKSELDSLIYGGYSQSAGPSRHRRLSQVFRQGGTDSADEQGNVWNSRRPIAISSESLARDLRIASKKRLTGRQNDARFFGSGEFGRFVNRRCARVSPSYQARNDLDLHQEGDVPGVMHEVADGISVSLQYPKLLPLVQSDFTTIDHATIWMQVVAHGFGRDGTGNHVSPTSFSPQIDEEIGIFGGRGTGREIRSGEVLRANDDSSGVSAAIVTERREVAESTVHPRGALDKENFGF